MKSVSLFTEWLMQKFAGALDIDSRETATCEECEYSPILAVVVGVHENGRRVKRAAACHLFKIVENR